MLFSLEALKAKYGDALLLHWGTVAKPRLAIIDGGPGGVFANALQPRLRQIAQLRGVSLPLDVQLAMISHIDGDHIQGVIELLRQIRDGSTPLAFIRALWHNHFDDFLGAAEIQALRDFGRSTGAEAASAGADRFDLAVATGVAQARRLRDLATQVGIQMNAGTTQLPGFVSAGDRVELGAGLTMRVLGPSKDQLEGLQTKWDASLSSLAGLSANERRARVAAFLDESVANLSSLVVYLQKRGKTMLLTGDARGDFILRALSRAGLMTRGRCRVDILKVPHHGSNRNVTRQFFEKVPASHYVISGNRARSHGTNPDVDTIQMITAARRSARYTMHFTYSLAPIRHAISWDQHHFNRKYTVAFPPPGERSVWVDLGNEELSF